MISVWLGNFAVECPGHFLLVSGEAARHLHVVSLPIGIGGNPLHYLSLAEQGRYVHLLALLKICPKSAITSFNVSYSCLSSFLPTVSRHIGCFIIS